MQRRVNDFFSLSTCSMSSPLERLSDYAFRSYFYSQCVRIVQIGYTNLPWILWPDNLEQAVYSVNFFAVSTKILLAVVRRGKGTHHLVARENLLCVSIEKGVGSLRGRPGEHARGCRERMPNTLDVSTLHGRPEAGQP